MRTVEKLAESLVESGQWLSYELYMAWIQEQNEPELEEIEEASTSERDAPTKRPGSEPRDTVVDCRDTVVSTA